MRAHGARSSGRLAKGGQGGVRARRSPVARGAYHVAAAARVARRRCRALCARRPAGRARRHASHRSFGTGKGWRHSRGGRLAIPAGEHCGRRIRRRADRGRAGARDSSRGWTWCARDSDAAGFIRRPDGSALPVDAPPPDGALPPELALALAQAGRAGSAPSCVRVDAPFAASSLSRWQRETGVDFRPGSPWRWEAAPPAAYADAVDLLPAHARAPARRARVRRGSLPPHSPLPLRRSSSMSLPPSANGRRCAMQRGAPSANGSALPPKPASRQTPRHPPRRLAPPLRADTRHCGTGRAFRRRTTRCPSSPAQCRHWPSCPPVP